MSIEQIVKLSGRGIHQLTYRQRYVRCKKQNCNQCPHGPYWYAYWRDGTKIKSKYIGKHLPEGVKR